MTPDMEAAKAAAETALRHQLAARVAVGLALAEALASVPENYRSEALRELGRLTLATGHEPFSEAEARLLARIAQQHPELRDPARVDLQAPATREASRQLAEVYRCVDRRALARTQAAAGEVTP